MENYILIEPSVGASLKQVVFAENSRGDLHFWGVNPSFKIYFKTVPNVPQLILFLDTIT